MKPSWFSSKIVTCNEFKQVLGGWAIILTIDYLGGTMVCTVGIGSGGLGLIGRTNLGNKVFCILFWSKNSGKYPRVNSVTGTHSTYRELFKLRHWQLVWLSGTLLLLLCSILESRV